MLSVGSENPQKILQEWLQRQSETLPIYNCFTCGNGQFGCTLMLQQRHRAEPREARVENCRNMKQARKEAAEMMIQMIMSDDTSDEVSLDSSVSSLSRDTSGDQSPSCSDPISRLQIHLQQRCQPFPEYCISPSKGQGPFSCEVTVRLQGHSEPLKRSVSQFSNKKAAKQAAAAAMLQVMESNDTSVAAPPLPPPPLSSMTTAPSLSAGTPQEPVAMTPPSQAGLQRLDDLCPSPNSSTVSSPGTTVGLCPVDRGGIVDAVTRLKIWLSDRYTITPEYTYTSSSTSPGSFHCEVKVCLPGRPELLVRSGGEYKSKNEARKVVAYEMLHHLQLSSQVDISHVSSPCSSHRAQMIGSEETCISESSVSSTPAGSVGASVGVSGSTPCNKTLEWTDSKHDLTASPQETETGMSSPLVMQHRLCRCVPCHCVCA